jgi:hypothetical protein
VAVAGPWPIFGSRDEFARDRITVHVLQLFDSLVTGKDVEVVVAGLPEGSLGETESLRDWRAFDKGISRSRGSPMRRWTCSGMTT